MGAFSQENCSLDERTTTYWYFDSYFYLSNPFAFRHTIRSSFGSYCGSNEFSSLRYLIALIPAISFSYLSGGISSALMVAGAYMIIHLFDNFLFTPLIIKKCNRSFPVGGDFGCGHRF